MTEIKCLRPFPNFYAGEKILVYLVSNDESNYELNYNTIVFLQIHGHIQVDKRWLKPSKAIDTILSDPHPSNLDHIASIPLDPTYADRKSIDGLKTSCLFTTSRIPASPSQILEHGLMVELDLPSSLYPTFKGRSISIQYYLSITLQSSDQARIVHYPLTIFTAPCGAYQAPFLVSSLHLPRYAGIVCYPPTSRPIDTHLNNTSLLIQQQQQQPQEEDRVNPHQQHQQQEEAVLTFKVSGEDGLICLLSLLDRTLILGQSLVITLDFRDQSPKETCQAVKISLVQVEKELILKDNKETAAVDGGKDEHSYTIQGEVTLQEKVLAYSIKSCLYAEELHMSIELAAAVAATITPSFLLPIFRVEYHLLCEFYAEMDKSSSSEGLPRSPSEPMSFKIPITIHGQESIAQRLEKKMDAAQSSSSHRQQQKQQSSTEQIPNYTRNQLVQLCLESQLLAPCFVEVN